MLPVIESALILLFVLFSLCCGRLVMATEEEIIASNAVEDFKLFCPYTDLCYSQANRSLENITEYETACCSECSCDQNCGLDCCPDKLSRYPTKDERSTLPECIYAQIRDYDEHKLNGIAYKMIGKCPKLFRNTMIERNCERSYQEFDFQEETKYLVPVTSLTTNTTFKNYHCALCNGALDTDLQFWNSQIVCFGNNILFLQSFSEIPSKLEAQHSCQINFISPNQENMLVEQCTDVINKCNVTGQWLEYSYELESACLSYTSSYRNTYKNFHCFLCNGFNISDITEICPIDFYGPPDTSVFLALLDFNSLQQPKQNRRNEELKCSPEERFDQLFVSCRSLTCPKGLLLKEDRCVPVFTSISPSISGRVVFSVSFYLIPTNLARSLSSQTLNIIEYSVITDILARSSLVQSVLDLHICNVTMLIKLNDTLEETAGKVLENSTRGIMPFVKYISVNVYLTANGIANMTKTIEELALIFTTASYFGHFRVQYTNGETPVPADVPGIGPDLLMRLFEELDEMLYGMFLNSVVDSTDGLGVMHFQNRAPPIECDALHSIQPQPFCPLVELKKEEFDIDVNAKTAVMINTKLSATPEVTKMTLSILLLGSNDSIFTCADDFFSYIRRTEELQTKLQESNNISNEFKILSLICLAISLVACLLTLTVYILFPRLRTIPGLNNMALVSTLFVAQALIFINSLTDISLRWLCSTFGVILHFALLSYFFWMFICTYYMMRMFLSIKDRSCPSQPWKKFLKYCLIFEVLAGLLVTLTIIVNVVVKVDDSIGYSGSVCYIRDRYRILYFVAIPLALVLVANFVMFIFVIVKILQTDAMAKGSSQNRNNFVIFIKLSTITGLTWIFAFLYQFTEVLLFAYADILFNAGQGVFIMLSFVCNRRVFEMVKGFSCKTKTRTMSRSSTYGRQTTMTKTSYTSRNNTINSNSTEFTTANNNISSNCTEFTTENNNISSNSTEFTTANNNINSNSTEFTTANNNINSNSTEFTTANNNISSITIEFTTENNNISSNSTEFTSENNNINSNSTEFSTESSNISSNSTEFTTESSNISSNSTEFTTESSNIGSNSTEISTESSNISSNSTEFTTESSNISSNSTEFTTANNNICLNSAEFTTENNNISSITTEFSTENNNICLNSAEFTTENNNISSNMSNSTEFTTENNNISSNSTEFTTKNNNISSNST